MFDKYLPNDKKEVVVIHPTEQIGPFYTGQGSTMCVIPFHDADGKVREASAQKLNTIKVVGWDYLPELLDRYSGSFLNLWFSTRFMHPKDVIAELENHKFKVTEIHCSTADIKTILTSKEDFKVQELTAYERARVLWVLHSPEFNSWEYTFVESLGKRLRDGIRLSSSQDLHLGRVFKKYKVTGSREQLNKCRSKRNVGGSILK